MSDVSQSVTLKNLSSQANHKIVSLLLSFGKRNIRAILWKSIKTLKARQKYLINAEVVLAEIEYVRVINFCENVLYRIQNLMDKIENCNDISEDVFINTRKIVSHIDLMYNQIFC